VRLLLRRGGVLKFKLHPCEESTCYTRAARAEAGVLTEKKQVGVVSTLLGDECSQGAGRPGCGSSPLCIASCGVAGCAW